MNSVGSRNYFLDALRGVGALMVLATHLQASLTSFYPTGWLAAHPETALCWSTAPSVWMSSSSFTGFIVSWAARRVIQAGRGARVFQIKRFLRIFIPYWPIALTLGSVYALWPGFSAGAEPIRVNLLKSITLIPGDGDYSLSVAWTLTFEVFFYLLLSFSLTIQRLSLRLLLVSAPSFLALLMSEVVASVGFGKATSLITLLASPCQWEFLLGYGVQFLRDSIIAGLCCFAVIGRFLCFLWF
jgi:exopolysaccharide production protein ExoZ